MMRGEADTIAEAAEKVGRTREALSRHINSDRGQELIQTKARKFFRGSTVPRAIGVFEHLLGGAVSERVRADLARAALTGAGVIGGGEASFPAGGITFNFLFGNQQPDDGAPLPAVTIDSGSEDR
ncbi:MAG: hypothetical protein WD341_01850 [Tistlia sp.]|uniref:hypothetical protein n=1 Tax=Tistlia sp. TaxID=3057121 RepID=UPI0034A483E4